MNNDAMYSIGSILLLVFLQFINVVAKCDSNAILWTYYPCSFMISTTSFYCQDVSINSTIDQCLNKEMTFFWHFPLGSMTLTLQSERNQPFLLQLSKKFFSANKSIGKIYHLVNSKTPEETLPYDNEKDLMVLSSDNNYQCSMKFETINSNIVDYGTFIRLKVLTNESNNR